MDAFYFHPIENNTYHLQYNNNKIIPPHEWWIMSDERLSGVLLISWCGVNVWKIHFVLLFIISQHRMGVGFWFFICITWILKYQHDLVRDVEMNRNGRAGINSQIFAKYISFI